MTAPASSRSPEQSDGRLSSKPRRSATSTDAIKLLALAILISAAGFFLAFGFVEPPPPTHITLATGEPGGAYARVADPYREILARYGITVEIRETSGTGENLALLDKGEVDVALAQGGIGSNAATKRVVSLGSIFYEPVWLFHNPALSLGRIPQLRDKRVSIGPPESGTAAAALRLFELNGIAPSELEIHHLEATDVPEALRAGRIDAAFMVAGVESPAVRSLVAAKDVALMSFERAEAYARLLPLISKLVLPEGVLELERNVPREDKSLIATAANLVVRKDFHPALGDLLLQAAAEVHGGRGVLERPGEFPSPSYIGLPLSDEARRYYKHGPPLLQRFLPFWVATQIDRLKVMLLPFVVLLIPLFRIFPPTYRWRVRSRIYRWYGQLRTMDLEPLNEWNAAEIQARFAALERIEQEVHRVPTPLSYAAELYALRVHIDLVRRQLEKAGEQSARDRGEAGGESQTQP